MANKDQQAPGGEGGRFPVFACWLDCSLRNRGA